MDGAILGGNDGPARLRLSCSAVNLLVEQVRVGGEVGGPDDLLLLLRKVAGEILNAFREHPDPSVGNCDVAEDWCSVLVELALHGFTSIGSHCGDGLHIRTPDPPATGTFIQLLLDVPTGEVRARAAVQRSSAKQGMGMESVANYSMLCVD